MSELVVEGRKAGVTQHYSRMRPTRVLEFSATPSSLFIPRFFVPPRHSGVTTHGCILTALLNASARFREEYSSGTLQLGMRAADV